MLTAVLYGEGILSWRVVYLSLARLSIIFIPGFTAPCESQLFLGLSIIKRADTQVRPYNTTAHLSAGLCVYPCNTTTHL
jgi:hypothetical protein